MVFKEVLLHTNFANRTVQNGSKGEGGLLRSSAIGAAAWAAGCVPYNGAKTVSFTRRDFLVRSSAVSAAFGALHVVGQRRSLGAALLEALTQSERGYGYGELVKDITGILDLPRGFRYSIVSRVGDEMDDGFYVPGKPDGMAAFPTSVANRMILVRNHEITDNMEWGGAFGAENELLSRVPDGMMYDRGDWSRPCLGGTTTVVFNTKTQRVEKQFLSLAGTAYNCAGGRTPWGSWLTCEETVQRREKTFEQDHGYVFEVPASATGLVKPVAYKAMGRFRHEACGINPDNSVVYMTEDVEDGLMYRYLPDTARELGRGGRLQAMVALDRKSLDARNWEKPEGAGMVVTPGDRLRVGWVDIEDVESADDSLRKQGFSKGAIKFARGEGAWLGREGFYFACSTGGKSKLGQIWRYRPPAVEVEGTAAEGTSAETSGTLTLFSEPNDTAAMANADNITMAPWGDLIICEDLVDEKTSGAGRKQYLVGLTPRGQVYKLGCNVMSGSELAGATFSPDGTTLFVNFQKNGLTLAITGPWLRA